MSQRLDRRRFVRDGVFVGLGLSAGVFLTRGVDGLILPAARAQQAVGSAEGRLKELGIVLPTPPKPVAVYVPAVRTGNLLFCSGHGPNRPDGTSVRGKVGGELTLEQGYEAAKLVGLNVLASVRSTLGSLDKVARVVKVLGLVNCTSEFAQQPQVINGFSELMVQVFGDQAGKGARSAVGTSALPNNIAVEIEAIFEVRE